MAERMVMVRDRLAGVLEEAVQSLTMLDAERLEQIERSLSTEVADGGEALFVARNDDALRAVVATHRLLGTLLESTSLNLNVLHGLRRRNDPGDGRWAR